MVGEAQVKSVLNKRTSCLSDRLSRRMGGPGTVWLQATGPSRGFHRPM